MDAWMPWLFALKMKFVLGAIACHHHQPQQLTMKMTKVQCKRSDQSMEFMTSHFTFIFLNLIATDRSCLCTTANLFCLFLHHPLGRKIDFMLVPNESNQSFYNSLLLKVTSFAHTNRLFKYQIILKIIFETLKVWGRFLYS